MSSPHRPVRLAEVAKRAGVLPATASRVLNGSSDRALGSIGEPYRQRVLAATAELGYRANLHAQAMARGASNVVGLIVHDVADPRASSWYWPAPAVTARGLDRPRVGLSWPVGRALFVSQGGG